MFVFGNLRTENKLLDMAIIIFRKKNKLFRMCGGWNSCRKVKYLWSSHFAEFISTNILIRNDFIMFKFRVKCKRKISNYHYFYWNLGNRLTFMCSPPMTSIIFHSRRPNTQENVSYVPDFCVLACVHFSHFEELINTFFTSFPFLPRVTY